MRVVVWVAIGMLLASPLAAGEKPQARRTPPTVHKTACSLAESMASKLGYRGKVKHDVAVQNCQMLVPTMNAKDHADFMRCCVRQLEAGPAAKPTPKSGGLEKTSS